MFSYLPEALSLRHIHDRGRAALLLLHSMQFLFTASYWCCSTHCFPQLWKGKPHLCLHPLLLFLFQKAHPPPIPFPEHSYSSCLNNYLCAVYWDRMTASRLLSISELKRTTHIKEIIGRLYSFSLSLLFIYFYSAWVVLFVFNLQICLWSQFGLHSLSSDVPPVFDSFLYFLDFIFFTFTNACCVYFNVTLFARF